MISFFVFLFGCVGLTLILSSSSLFDKPRGFIREKSEFVGELVECPMCLGMWVGFASSLLILSNTIFYAIYYGGMISLLSYFFATLMGLLNNLSYLIELNYGDEDE
jgi:hypothetical protein